jgi:hypothetical protein
MSRAVRIALICLLAFTLPLQGAMAGMLACAALHGELPAAGHGAHDAGRAAARATHEHHSHAMQAHHGQARTHDAAPGSLAADLSDAAQGTEGASPDSCSLCANCCTAAAPPAAAHSPTALPAAQAMPAAASSSVDGIVPGGLERPPRPLSA